MSGADLVARAQAGDRDALAAVLADAWRVTRARLLARGLSRADAEDAAQEAAARVLANLAAFDPTRAAFGTWYLAAAKGAVVLARRRVSREDVPLEDAPEPVAPEPEEPAGPDPRARRLDELLPRLSPRQRTVIADRRAGVPVATIAARDGCTVKGIKKLIGEARAALLAEASGARRKTGPRKQRARWTVEDLTGRTIGRLVALERLPRGHWRCRCVCGTERVCRTGDLRDGRRYDCGDAACRAGRLAAREAA